MSANVGMVDQGLRLVVGLALIGFALYQNGAWWWVGLAGAVMIGTALVRFCPAYWLLRIRTVARPGRHAA